MFNIFTLICRAAFLLIAATPVIVNVRELIALSKEFNGEQQKDKKMKQRLLRQFLICLCLFVFYCFVVKIFW